MQRHAEPPIARPVTPSKRRQQKVPPGGSNFGGHYHKKAFAAYVFPRDGAKQLEMRDFEEARGANAPGPDLTHTVALTFHGLKEEQKPSRLRLAFDHRKANPPAMPGWEMRAEAMLKGSASSPALMKAATPEASPKSGGAASPSGTMEMSASGKVRTPHPDEVTPEMLNPSHQPHPTLTRGAMMLSKGRARDWGIDLTEAPGFKCPFYEAPKDRLALKKEVPDSNIRQLEKSRRWTDADAWENPEHHATYKVTQVDGTGPSPLSTMPGGRASFRGPQSGGRFRSGETINMSKMLGGYGKSESPDEPTRLP